MLAIEIDGMSHNHGEAFIKDELRQQKLESFGIVFIRFSESEMKNDMPNVIRTIESTIIDIVRINPKMKLPPEFDLALLK
jgi:very-short-patch-repair endonuclease